jgi:hypothetical protein
MKESSTIAYSYAQNFLHRTNPENDFFSKAKISMHVPEGATPKVGFPWQNRFIALLVDCVWLKGRPVGGHHHGNGAHVSCNGTTGGARHCYDGRSVAYGQGAARWRHQGKSACGAPGQCHDHHSPWCGFSFHARGLFSKMECAASNEADYKDLAADIREGLAAHFVQQYSEVYAIAFPS